METKRNLYLSVVKDFISTLLLGTLVCLTYLNEANAQNKDVHFGSVFVKGNTPNLDVKKESLNVLTDQSTQQQTLEGMHPGLAAPNKRYQEATSKMTYSPLIQPQDSQQYTELVDQSRMIQSHPENVALKAPAGVTPEKNNRIGVANNKELNKSVVYFLELRPYQMNSPKRFYSTPSMNTSQLGRLVPGEIVKVTDTVGGFVHKKRMDRDNQGVWKTISGNYQNPFYVYYDWKNFETLIPSESPIEMDILVPRTQGSIPVYSMPGAWTERDCGLNAELCLDRIDQHSDTFLFDTVFVKVNDLRLKTVKNQLFYKVGYRAKDKSGNVKHKLGWIPSYYARRKISQVPKKLLAGTGFSGFETDKERITRLKKYYIFRKNMNSENRLTNRWVKEQPGQKVEVFDQTIALDGIMGFQYMTLNQSFRTQTFNQYSLMAGLGIYAPLYVDLEVQGHFILNIPVQYQPQDVSDFESAFMFRGDQWLMYTTPIGINKLPLKIGIGGYYVSMFKSETTFGFKSFVGFQVKAMLENESFWLDARYGPTGEDLNFNFDNREVGMSLGYRFDPEKAFNSWTAYFDYGSTTFTSSTSKQTTKYDVIQLGIKKAF